MSLIGKTIEPFNAKAYHNEEFIDVSDENLKGNWSVVCFYRRQTFFMECACSL